MYYSLSSIACTHTSVASGLTITCASQCMCEYMLSNQELIATLEEAKSKAVEISQKLSEASATASQIEEVRARYKPAALRGAVLFFVLASLAAISNMYEYSLASFLAVFSRTLDTSKKVCLTRVQLLV